MNNDRLLVKFNVHNQTRNFFLLAKKKKKIFSGVCVSKRCSTEMIPYTEGGE